MPRKLDDERCCEEKIRWGRRFIVVIKIFRIGFIEQRPAGGWRAPLGICGRKAVPEGKTQEPDVELGMLLACWEQHGGQCGRSEVTRVKSGGGMELGLLSSTWNVRGSSICCPC